VLFVFYYNTDQGRRNGEIFLIGLTLSLEGLFSNYEGLDGSSGG